MILWLAALGVGYAAVPLTDEEASWLRQHPVLTVGTFEGGWPPFEMEVQGHPSGLSHDYLNWVTRELGVATQQRTYPDWPSLLDAACRGEIDVIMSVSITSARTRCLSFTRPYLSNAVVLVGPPGDARLRTTASLERIRIAVESEFAVIAQITEWHPEADLVIMPDTASALDAVAEGGADAYVGNPFAASHVLGQKPRPNLAILGRAGLPNSTLHFATPNDRRQLASAIDKALMEMGEATRERINARWLEASLSWTLSGTLSLSPQERQWLRRLPALRVVFDPTWAPLTPQGDDGRMSGILGDYLQRMEDVLNVTIQPVKVKDWQEARALIESGQVDIAPAVDNVGYGPQWRATRPLVTFPCVLVTRHDAPALAGLVDLAYRRVAVSDPEHGARVRAAAPSVTLVDVPSDRAGLTAVERQQVDAYIGNLATVDDALRDDAYSELRVAAPTGFEDNVGFVVRAPYAPLAGLFDRVASKMGEEEKQAIRRRWLTVDYRYGVAWSTVALASGIGLIIISALIAAYLKLRAEIRRRQESDARLTDITRNLPAVVFELCRGSDGDYSFSYIAGNPAPMFGVDTQQIITEPNALIDRVAEADRAALLDALENSARALEPVSCEFRSLGPEGWGWTCLSAIPQAAGNDAVRWAGYWIDTTDRHAQTEALAQAREEAVAATEAKSNFLAVMSHEIRTPMAGLSGMLELLGRTALNKEQRRLLVTSMESASSLRHILDDILDFSKVEAGDMRLEATEVDLRQIICNVLELLAAQAQEKELAVECDLDPSLAALHIGDPIRLRQILFNLVGNAIKFTHEGSVAVRAFAVDDGDHQVVHLCVQDTGIGLSTDQQAALFRPFAQADITTTRHYGGTGLGLSICQRLVELMGGRLALESTEGIGTRLEMIITLPIHRQSTIDVNIVGQVVQIEVADPSLCSAVQRVVRCLGLVSECPPGTAPDALITDDPAWTAIMPDTSAILLQPQDVTGASAKGIVVHSDPLLYCALHRALQSTLQGEVEPSWVSASTPAKGRRLARPILVVEDHPTNRMLVGLQLEELGYAYLLAGDGAEALSILDRVSPSMLLTDISMPTIDGYTLAQYVRRREAGHGDHLPILAMTANVLATEIERCYASGMDGHLLKPVDLQSLQKALTQWIPEAPALPGRQDPAISGPSDLVTRYGAQSTDVITSFLTAMEGDIAVLRECITTRDSLRVIRQIHRIAGAVSQLGLEQTVSITAQQLMRSIPVSGVEANGVALASFVETLQTLCLSLQGPVVRDAR